MADHDQNPLEPLVDNLPEDLITFSTDPKKVVTKKVVNAYWNVTLAGAAKFIPALAILTSGQGQIVSQEQPVRKPDEQQSSQSRNSNSTLEEAFEGALSTGSGASSTVSVPVSGNLTISGEVVRMHFMGMAQLEASIQPLPLVDVAADKNDKKT